MRQTASTTTFNRGDVVLVPFPFTNLRGSTYRPGLVVSNDGYNQATTDIIIAQVTGNVTGRPRVGDHHITKWRQSGLAERSTCWSKSLRQALLRRFTPSWRWPPHGR
ncbi:MAG: type II toxin-antitoxin system PemK/MazF family toxin [Chloroflexi bacterium]|nr:type II toxin-antitoxin system PemK/MazF family toxin [Chloroflexota bacterium]